MKVCGASEQGGKNALGNFFLKVDAMGRPTLEYLRVCHVLPIIIKIYRASSFSARNGRWEDCLACIESVLLIVLQTMIGALLLGTFVSGGQIFPNIALAIRN